MFNRSGTGADADRRRHIRLGQTKFDRSRLILWPTIGLPSSIMMISFEAYPQNYAWIENLSM